MSVSVIGAGAFGTALATALADNGPVSLWGRDPDQTAAMAAARENARYLPGCAFPETLQVSTEIASALTADVILLAIPMQALAGFAAQHDLTQRTIIACCKGIDMTTGDRPSGVLSSAHRVAVLTGPSFAQDIARGLPTALTLACADADTCAQLQQKLSTPTLRLYRSSDVIGAELGGALKNVIAIACGAVMGAGLGTSARAALLTRGFAEMQRAAVAMRAEPETLMGLSGFGDLVLTCTSDQSRNYRYGAALGAGDRFDPSVTVEGVATAQAVLRLARDKGLDMPVCEAVADLVSGRIDVAAAMNRLLARPLKEE